MKKFYTGLLISLMITAIFAQETYPQTANNKINDNGDDKDASILNQNNHQPKFNAVHSNWETFDNVYRGNPDKLLSEKKTNFGLSENDELQLKSQNADDLAIEHKRYQQYYKGVKVEGGEYILHSSFRGYFEFPSTPR